MKNTRSADFCGDQIDVIMNIAVITNVVIKRVHCIIVMDDFERPFCYLCRKKRVVTQLGQTETLVIRARDHQ